MVTDLIITWPRNCDYPKWRKYLRDNRTKFNEVIIAFMETNHGYDYQPFLRTALFKDYAHIIDAPIPRPPQDWRNLAINAALLHSYNAPWVYFTEQDFYPLPGFYDQIEAFEQEGKDVIAVYEGPRMHPCSIFIKRTTLQKLTLDFGIIPNISDHFSIIQNQLESTGANIGKIDPKTYTHMAGLSSNMTLLENNQQPNHKPDQFKAWMIECANLKGIELDPHFLSLCTPYL